MHNQCYRFQSWIYYLKPFLVSSKRYANVFDDIVNEIVCESVNRSMKNYHLLTYLLPPWCRVLLEKLTGLQLVKKFRTFHGTRRFITAITSVRHLSLSRANPTQSIYPHPTSWRSILILSTHLRLGLPSSLLPSGFPTKTLYTPFPHQDPIHPLSSPIRATCPAHLILLDFITRTILVRITNHLAPRYAISSIPPLRRIIFYFQKFSLVFSKTVREICLIVS